MRGGDLPAHRAQASPGNRVRQVLHAGNERASAIAAATLDEVRAAMGMRY